jgi:hypothetical protein
MASIMPDASAGGVVVRDAAGVDTAAAATAPSVYTPDAAFVSCPQTAFPAASCALSTPQQMNAISSELLGLAEALSPVGPWDCARSDNLKVLFDAYRSATGTGAPATGTWSIG